MASIRSDFGLVPVCILIASVLHSAAAELCGDCTDDCCFDYDGNYYCCYNVASTWWFWFMWGMILLVILVSCCAIIRRRRLRRRQVIIVQQGYTTPTAYGTLVNTETPQQPYAHATHYPYGGYPNPPPGPAPPYHQQVAAGVQPAQPVEQAQAVANKQAEYNPNEKPPPYNPGS